MDRDWLKSDPDGAAQCMRPPEFNNAVSVF